MVQNIIRSSNELSRDIRTSTKTNRVPWLQVVYGASRPVIPFGPLFQADVPAWTDPIHSYVSKWLGTKVWPNKYAKRTTVEEDDAAVGKGRPDSCLCSFPGSVECVKLHVSEKTNQLKSDLGPAFQKWKFREMGNAVADLWSSCDQRIFHSLVRKSNLASDGESFLNLVLRRLPSKSREDVVSYYLNVYIPQRMRMKIKAGFDKVDSDEDVEKAKTCRKRRRSWNRQR